MWTRSNFQNSLTSGRIGDIIDNLLRLKNETLLENVDLKSKIEALCFASNIAPSQLDRIIAENPPVLRTIKGHAFEFIFDKVMEHNGINSEEVGGDSGVDRVVNGVTLQLKTPFFKGTNSLRVQYKTHKTHGAKSEGESMGYYYSRSQFADYLVGLHSYEPLQMFVIPRAEIPGHPKDNNYIQSPFSIPILNSTFINNFSFMGIGNLDISSSAYQPTQHEILPLTAGLLNLNSEVIINTILNCKNFRIWDMNLRGFIREYKVKQFLLQNNLKIFDTASVRSCRPEKSDFTLKRNSNVYEHFQIKGITYNLCRFRNNSTLVNIESQLSRGRINDHPTQSRLYFTNDFDFLILSLDPVYVKRFRTLENYNPEYDWEFFAIPTYRLRTHSKYHSRINPHQRFSYPELLQYKIDNSWCADYQAMSHS